MSVSEGSSLGPGKYPETMELQVVMRILKHLEDYPPAIEESKE